MRNYFIIEETNEGLFLAEGTGSNEDVDYDESEHWNDWEEMKDEKQLFKRIKELLAR